MAAAKAKETIGTGEDLLIWRNEAKIKKDTEHEGRFLSLFQPFVTALLKNNFEKKPGIDTIVNLITSGQIDVYLKKEALKITPTINNMPSSYEVRLNLIDASVVFENYDAIKAAWARLPKKEFERNQILYMDMDENGTLTIPEHRKLEIELQYSVYALNQQQAEAYKRAGEILEAIKAFHAETGCNLFYPEITPSSIYEIEKSFIDPYAFKRYTQNKFQEEPAIEEEPAI